MRFLRYAGPADAFDGNQLFGKKPEEEQKFVFFAFSHERVPADWRGNVNEVTDAEAEQLLTYPNHLFVEVPTDEAKQFNNEQRVARANREGLEHLRKQHEFQAPSLEGGVQRGSTWSTRPAQREQPQVAPMAPRSAEEVKADVAAEKKALEKVEKAAKADKEG